MDKKRYDFNFLQILVKELDVKLLKDYSEEKLNKYSKINCSCKNLDCNNTFTRQFMFLDKSKNTLCTECNDKNKRKNIKNAYLHHNINNLKKIVEKYGLILLKDYSKELSQKTIIKGKCTKENCNNNIGLTFEYLLKSENTFCCSCTKEERKRKVKETCMLKYGVESAFLAEDVKKNIELTCIKKYGVKTILSSKEIQNKIKETNLSRYNCEYPTQNKEIFDKIKKTNEKKYGEKFLSKTSYFKNKAKETNLIKYGTEYASQSECFKEKVKNTNLEKYGTICILQNEDIKKKISETNFKKFGNTCAAKSEIVKQIIKDSTIKKYGVENVMQSPEVAEKASKNAYLLKEYTFPSGKIIKTQGYENFGLDLIIKNEKIKEDNIITSRKSVPEIWYNDNKNKKHRHFVDIFINSQNRCIEVKSTWTFKKNRDVVFLKQDAAKKLGYLYEIWVFDDKSNMVESYK